MWFLGYDMFIWRILFPFIVGFTLASSIRLALQGFVRFPEIKILKWLTSRAWCLWLFIFLPSHIGEFGRGETSPIPWKAFIYSANRHGIVSGVYSACIVSFVDLWLLWIPANMWINSRSGLDNEKKYMARIINLLLGLLLMTNDNPIYRLID